MSIPLELATGANPLIRAGKVLLADLFSALAFVVLYTLFHNIYVATGVAISIGLGQIGYLKFRDAPIDLMQWLSLFLVVVFGSAALITRNPVFIMVKPTLIYAAIGTVMLRPNWMNRYAPPIVLARAADITRMFGYLWAGLMFATGAANLAVAVLASPALWAWFLGVLPIASKVALFVIQYAVTRIVVRRRV